MRFKFDVGTEENHQVEFNFGRFRRKISIIVDGKIARKDMVLAYYDLIMGIFLLTLLSLGILSLDLISLAFIWNLAALSTILINLYVSKFRSYELTVGKEETHVVEITMVLKGWLGKRVYTVFIDGQKVKTFQDPSIYDLDTKLAAARYKDLNAEKNEG